MVPVCGVIAKACASDHYTVMKPQKNGIGFQREGEALRDPPGQANIHPSRQ